jgi:hypothetical protein
MTGSAPGEREQQGLLRKYPDLPASLPPLDDVLRLGAEISYTQWEAWLALYHGKLLLTAKAEPAAPRGPKFAPTEQSRTAQSAHLGRLEMVRRYPGCTFGSSADLARHIAYTAILDLLVGVAVVRVAKSRYHEEIGVPGEVKGALHQRSARPSRRRDEPQNHMALRSKPQVPSMRGHADGRQAVVRSTGR